MKKQQTKKLVLGKIKVGRLSESRQMHLKGGITEGACTSVIVICLSLACPSIRTLCITQCVQLSCRAC